MRELNFFAEREFDKLYFFLKEIGMSESLISFLRRDAEAVKINGKIANMRSRLSRGDMVQILLRDKSNSDIPFNDLKLEILFENEDILVVNKPSGIATIPSKSHFADSLAGAVCKYMSGRSPCFVYRVLGRLDKDTAGIVVIAKNLWAATKTKIEKSYAALCEGKIESDELEIDSKIQTLTDGQINRRRRITSDSGKPAKTKIRVLKRFENASLIEAEIEHGRTHQIRVHLSEISHPLVDDEIYGNGKNSHAMLVCKSAKIELPTGEKLSLEIDFPDEFLKTLDCLTT